MPTKMNPEFEGVCENIFKVHKMLEDAAIQHEFMEESYASLNSKGTVRTLHKYHICYPSVEDCQKGLGYTQSSNMVCSVIEGFGTYGLEIMGLLTPEEEEHSPVRGYLTPEDVFSRIEKAEEKRNLLFRHTAPVDPDYLVEEED